MKSTQFNLRLLLWLVACIAFVCWLLTPPPLFVGEILGYDMIDPDTPSPPEYYATHWPLEVAIRIALGVVIFALPLVILKLKSRHPANRPNGFS